MLDVQLVPCLSDNYAYLIHDRESGATGIVDPSEAPPVMRALEQSQLTLDFVINTHHHWDHTGGNLELKKKFGATVVGSAVDKDRVPGIDVTLGDGDVWHFGEHAAKIMFIPGHTIGHIAFHFGEDDVVFTGDTLFSLGCGKLFEGTPEQMWNSLCKLRDLPDETRVYCGHEYTANNAAFAVTVDPENRDLEKRRNEVLKLRGDDQPTIPSTMGLERRTNPFLRADDSGVRHTLGLSDDGDVDVFAEIRRRKDSF